MAQKRKQRLDPWEEYKVVDTYNTDTNVTFEDILTSKEFVDFYYKLLIKYS